MQIYIPGPLHPDLFDGETPMMIKAEVEEFDVSLSCENQTDACDCVFSVAAANEEEAKQVAIFANRCEGLRCCEPQVETVEWLSYSPSNDEVDRYKQFRASQHGAGALLSIQAA